MTKIREIGYLINIGLTSCRIFSVLSDSTLKEGPVTSYPISDPTQDGYLDGIIGLVKNNVLPLLADSPQMLQKVFVDTKFAEVFHSPSEEKDFIRRFYKDTNLYFNVLSPKQTKENLTRLFGKVSNGTVIINIGSRGVDVLEIKNDESVMYSLPLRLDTVNKYLERKGVVEFWTEDQIATSKRHIKKQISGTLKGIRAENAIIIKDELDFMKDNGYQIVEPEQGMPYVTLENYKKANHEKLFCVDYLSKLKDKYSDEAEIKRFHGFKTGHLILETIFELLDIKNIYPSNQHSIHGNINAYVFNVVLSGSTDQNRIGYIEEANSFMQKFGANVLSPSLDNLGEITTETDYFHLKAIDDCDVLFVCNKDKYVGESTRCEIYYAYAIRKTIAFWNQPDDEERFAFIPHEHWEQIPKLNELE